MNNEYSKINWPDFRQIKKMYKKNPAQVNALLSLQNKYGLQINDSIPVEVSLQARLLLENCYENYFIEPDVFNFLKSLEIKNALDNNFYLLMKDKFSNKFYDFIKNFVSFIENNHEFKIKIDGLCGILYAKNITRSWFFTFKHYITPDDNKLHFDLFLNDGEDSYIINLADKKNFILFEECHFIVYEIASVIINMFYYMDAYPDSITNLPPNEIIDSLNRKNSYTLKVNEEIKPFITKEVMPHLRRGHFKTLQSEYYVNKRFQTIFIKPTFIHGDVKTITKKEKIKLS